MADAMLANLKVLHYPTLYLMFCGVRYHVSHRSSQISDHKHSAHLQTFSNIKPQFTNPWGLPNEQALDSCSYLLLFFLLKKENQKIGEAVTLSAIDDLGRALRVGVVIAGELR